MNSCHKNGFLTLIGLWSKTIFSLEIKGLGDDWENLEVHGGKALLLSSSFN
jgi:hypothetical protein